MEFTVALIHNHGVVIRAGVLSGKMCLSEWISLLVYCIYSQGRCNGVALWMEYRLNHDHVVSSGLLSDPIDGCKLQWDPHTRQGVHLFPSPTDIDPASETSWTLRHHVMFKPRSGDFDFEFTLIPSTGYDDEVRLDWRSHLGFCLRRVFRERLNCTQLSRRFCLVLCCFQVREIFK